MINSKHKASAQNL